MIKKLLLKVTLMVVFFFGLGSFASYQMTGTVPVFNAGLIDKVKASFNETIASIKKAVNSAGNTVAETTEGVYSDGSDAEAKVKAVKQTYRWTGPDGSLNFGDTPPADASNIQVMEGLGDNISVVDSVRPPAKPVSNYSDGVSGTAPIGSAPVNPYTPTGARQAIDQARQVQQQMNERIKQREEAMKGLR